MDLFRLKAHELQQKLSRREVSAVEITQSVLARADQVDSTIQSFITRTPEAALVQAKRACRTGTPGANKSNEPKNRRRIRPATISRNCRLAPAAQAASVAACQTK